MVTTSEKEELRDLIKTRMPGYGLPGQFYQSELVYRAELDRIWRRGWLFAGHTCQIPQPGDYMTMHLDNDSLVIVHQDDGSLRAFHNLCRHRGTEICHEETGRVGRFVCPYHQWTYGRDGALVSCRGMPEANINKSELSLLPVHVRQIEGMIFVSLADTPLNFEEAAAHMGPYARPQGLERAKVAKIVDYEVPSNWKIVWENNRECYHCNANHPQYTKANYDHFNADDTSPKIQSRMDAAVARSHQKWADAGLAVSHRSTGMATFPDPDRNCWFSANRTAMADGYVSETMEGKQVAPLMGDYTDPDVGTLRMRTMPNLWHHSSCDHSVSTRLTPAGRDQTNVRVTWLVDQDAVEGRDYELDQVIPFWKLTSEQDWELCARAQRGVMSSRYVPGPFSPQKEYNVDAFVRWYLQQLSIE